MLKAHSRCPPCGSVIAAAAVADPCGLRGVKRSNLPGRLRNCSSTRSEIKVSHDGTTARSPSPCGCTGELPSSVWSENSVCHEDCQKASIWIINAATTMAEVSRNTSSAFPCALPDFFWGGCLLRLVHPCPGMSCEDEPPPPPRHAGPGTVTPRRAFLTQDST